MKLALYHYPTCFYCRRVRKEIQRLGIEVEERDIWSDSQAMQDLVNARGRRTVPVLKIQEGDSVKWMPESRDIIHFLREKFS